MSQAAASARTPARPALPGLPRGELTPQQQLEALHRLQNQAEQRVKLGLQLFKAAEARAGGVHELIDQVKTETQRVRDQIQEDVARSLHAYDQWMGELDEGFNHALRALEQRIDQLQSDWGQSQRKIEAMLQRSEALLDQSRYVLDTVASEALSGPRRRAAGPGEPAASSEPAVGRGAATTTAARPTAAHAEPPSHAPPAAAPAAIDLYTEALARLRPGAEAAP